jgi:hypothetical protein
LQDGKNEYEFRFYLKNGDVLKERFVSDKVNSENFKKY